jgi:spore coat protein CotH
MRRLAFAAVLLIVCTPPALSQTAGRPVSRRVQPLLGVGQLPTPPAPVTADGFFDDQGPVQDIYIDINAKDWQALKDNFLANTYYPADLRWNGQTVRNVGIRSRGTATRSPAKPGLRIDFDRYMTNQTFLGLKSVNVKNNLTDPSSMRERIAMKLFQRMGVQTPREASVRLLVNGVYDGLYTLVESPDKGFLQRTLQQNDGYLYKFDRDVGDAPYYFEYVGADPSAYVPHPWQPETHASDPRPEPIVEMIRTAAEAPDDDAFIRQESEYLDLVAVVRHVAIENYLAEFDGLLGGAGMNNFYLYRLEHSTKHVVIPWDKSETFALGPYFDILFNIENVAEAQQNRLWTRIWRIPALREVYFDTLLQCADSAAEGAVGDERTWMEREADREYAQIRAQVVADPKSPFTEADFEAAASWMRFFSRERPRSVREQVGALREQRTSSGVAGAGVTALGRFEPVPQ